MDLGEDVFDTGLEVGIVPRGVDRHRLEGSRARGAKGHFDLELSRRSSALIEKAALNLAFDSLERRVELDGVP